MPDILSRQDAIRLGRKRFYTGKLCKHNHDCERYTVNGGCVLCINPKLPEGEKPPALEQFKLSTGRVIDVCTQEQAHARGRKYFFTGQPCDEGHMAERDVKSGRCLQCMHPPKYGPDGFTGWWPFQPKPPLRVPPGTPLTVWHALAERLQAEIPRIVQELGVTPVAPQETKTAYTILHVHDTRPQFVRGEFKLWFPFIRNGRGLQGCPDWMRPEAYPDVIPWIEHQGHWYALLPDNTTVHVVKEGHGIPYAR